MTHRFRLVLVAVAGLCALVTTAAGQTYTGGTPRPSSGPYAAPSGGSAGAQPALAQPRSPSTSAPAVGGTASTFKPEEFEQVVAPVALYPDSLLAQVLMASTYPLEVVQAERWAKAN